jgi:hypothetical protein
LLGATVRGPRRVPWFAVAVVVIAAFGASFVVARLLDHQTVAKRIASAVAARWTPSSLSCSGTAATVKNVGGRNANGPIYQCSINGVPVGFQTAGRANFTHCYVISARDRVLDVTNTIVYLRKNGASHGLSCR